MITLMIVTVVCFAGVSILWIASRSDREVRALHEDFAKMIQAEDQKIDEA